MVDYDFTIVLNTNNPNSEEFEKLTHHMDYLINFEEAEFPTSIYNVNVKATNDNSVEITGEMEIEFNEDELSDDEVADILSDMVNEEGWEDLDVTLASVSVTKYVGESRDHKLQEADDEELEDIDEEESENNELEDTINDLKEKSGFYEYAIEDIIEDSANYEDGTQLEKIKKRCNEILDHGCVSGVVSSLIYYSDTVKVFDTYVDDIYDLIEEYGEDEFLDMIKGTVSTVEILINADTSKNWIVWRAYEEVAYQLSNALEDINE